MWAFKQLWDKGLLYEGYRVLPYCWECETPAVQLRDPPGRRLPRPPGPGGHRRLRARAGRRRPAAAMRVGVDDHAVDPAVQPGPRRRPRRRLRACSSTTAAGRGRRGAGGRLRGAARRAPPWSPPSRAPSWSAAATGRCSPTSPTRRTPSWCSAADFVTTEEGTGVVHMAPGFGEDDQLACEAAGIAVVCPVDDRGPLHRRGPRLRGAAGLRGQPADHPRPAGPRACWSARLLRPQLPALLAHRHAAGLQGGQLVVRRGDCHQGPHARAQPADHLGARRTSRTAPSASGWRVPVTGRSPATASGVRRSRCGRATTRRTPAIDVYGSLDELEADFGVRPADLHRPAVDELVRPNPDDPTGRSMMRRVTDVLDCWFESGSMPFAQVHYPFENAEWFEEHFPADFIVEYIGQTRGWFYTLHVLATALFDRPAFRTCLAHGIVLGDDGQKMSKRLRNYPDPEAMFAKYGADAMRWFLLSSPVLRGGDIVVDEKGIVGGGPLASPPAVERLVFLHPVRQRRRPGSADRRGPTARGARPLHPGQGPRRWSPTSPRRMDRYDLSGACDAGRVLPRRLDQLVHPPEPGPVLGHLGRRRGGGRQRRRLRHPGHGARGAVPDRGPAAAARHRGGLARACTGGHAGGPSSVHLADWPSPDACPPTPTWSRPWTGSGTCARRPTRSARPGPAGPAPARGPDRRRPRRRRAGAVCGPDRRRGQRQRGPSRRRRRRRWPTAS